MSLFKKRESLTQNIAYMGIMASINVIAIVLMNYVLPILFLPFALIMPLTSTVVTLFCQKRYFIIYAVTTIGLCFLVSINNISDTLFYVIPSVISGFAFGLMIEYSVPMILAIFVGGIINAGLASATLPLINYMYGQDMVKVIATLFGLGDYQYLSYIVPSFILLIGLAQSLISFVLIINELPKLGIEEKERNWSYVYPIIGLFGSLLSLLAFLFFRDFAFFFMIFAVFFGVYVVTNNGFNKAKKSLIIDGIILALFIIYFALVYQYVEAPFGLLLINVLFDLFFFESLVNYSLTKTPKSVE